MRIHVDDIPPSLNAYWAGAFWAKRAKVADTWHGLFLKALVEAGIKKPLQTPLIIEVTEYSPRIRDCDNAVIASKLFGDTLVLYGYIPDDTPEFISEVRLKSTKGQKKTIIDFQYDTR